MFVLLPANFEIWNDVLKGLLHFRAQEILGSLWFSWLFRVIHLRGPPNKKVEENMELLHIAFHSCSLLLNRSHRLCGPRLHWSSDFLSLLPHFTSAIKENTALKKSLVGWFSSVGALLAIWFWWNFTFLLYRFQTFYLSPKAVASHWKIEKPYPLTPEQDLLLWN